MPTVKKKIVVGNWKMHPLTAKDARRLFMSLEKVANQLRYVETIICVPSIHLGPIHNLSFGPRYHLGTQDAYWEDEGAYTGEVSTAMVKAYNVEYCLVGHSERRAFGETDEMINKKIKACLEHEITPILCIGETERGKGKKYLTALKNQLDGGLQGIAKKYIPDIVIAYEPVWSVGAKAKVECTPETCKDAIEYIHKYLTKRIGASKAESVHVLYGGSVDNKDARDFVQASGVDGVLLGRASLDPRIFSAILRDIEDFAYELIHGDNTDTLGA